MLLWKLRWSGASVSSTFLSVRCESHDGIFATSSPQWHQSLRPIWAAAKKVTGPPDGLGSEFKAMIYTIKFRFVSYPWSYFAWRNRKVGKKKCILSLCCMNNSVPEKWTNDMPSVCWEAVSLTVLAWGLILLQATAAVIAGASVSVSIMSIPGDRRMSDSGCSSKYSVAPLLPCWSKVKENNGFQLPGTFAHRYMSGALLRASWRTFHSYFCRCSCFRDLHSIPHWLHDVEIREARPSAAGLLVRLVPEDSSVQLCTFCMFGAIVPLQNEFGTNQKWPIYCERQKRLEN